MFKERNINKKRKTTLTTVSFNVLKISSFFHDFFVLGFFNVLHSIKSRICLSTSNIRDITTRDQNNQSEGNRKKMFRAEEK